MQIAGSTAVLQVEPVLQSSVVRQVTVQRNCVVPYAAHLASAGGDSPHTASTGPFADEQSLVLNSFIASQVLTRSVHNVLVVPSMLVKFVNVLMYGLKVVQSCGEPCTVPPWIAKQK